AYSGPYEMIGIPVSNAGYPVYGLDYRGHGLSDGTRGDYKSRRQMAQDLIDAVDFVKKGLNHKKLILFGHSLGVAAAILALHHKLDDIMGVILFSAARRFRPEVYPSLNFMEKFKILFSAIFTPSKPVINYEREGMRGLDDPLFNFNYSLRFMRLIDTRKMAAPKGMAIPVFMGVGDQDELFEVEAVKELFEEVPGEDKIFHVVKGARHAHFPDGCWKPVIEWLDEHFR
ncbi:MAG: alpha/beta fold hydrolase, partial [Candidatus Lokiarchaeota archaeon]|nr:alpha/beta fold hydrolase [Candidatus Lokiarchaeota archaeon]